MIKIIIKENKLNPDHLDYSPNLFNLAFMAELRNAKKQTVGEDIEYFISTEKVDLELALQLNTLGVEVLNYPTFIDVSTECPFTYLDEEGVEQAYTWETWKKDNHIFMEVENDEVYLGSNAHTDEYLSIKEVVDNNLTVIDTATLKSKMPVSNDM